MVRITFIILFILLLAEENSQAQSCNCAAQLAFAEQKIETNYAGFKDKVNPATRRQYDEHTRKFAALAATKKKDEDCYALVKEWMGFFKDGHLQLQKKTNTASAPARPATANSERFYFKQVDPQTTLIRIASFNHVYKRSIDSVIRHNQAAIAASKYLLLDLRDNGGGSDVSYSELIPFLYTRPIITVGSAKLSTADNINKYERMSLDTFYSADSRNYARQMIAQMKAAPGEFVPGTMDTLTLDAALSQPQLVGIIINKKCASTTEQFLLAAMQSRKAVIFGENSGGILDYANMHFLDFPCGDWRLGYAISRSMRLPEMPVDNIGVSPDIRIESTEKDWVGFAAAYLAKMPSVDLASLGYKDTAQVDMKMLASGIAGNSSNTFDKVRNVIWWTNKNFKWNYTDYQRRTSKQIICRQGGNCAEQALVVRSILKELNVKTRRTSEINIQPESARRQKDAEERIAAAGNRSSVFGYRHNDHVWTEFYDEEKQDWVPADPTLGLIGLENWLKSRIGFAPRVNHSVIASADMLVPIAVFALNADGTIAENRSSYYLIQSFNATYNGQLEKLPSWSNWKQSVEFIQGKAREAFEGKTNLHEYSEYINGIKNLYELMKGEYLQAQMKK